MSDYKHIRPIKRFVLLLDDQPERTENGIILQSGYGSSNMDYLVVRVGESESVDFGQGDRVLISDPNAGRRVMIDGVVYRLVRVADIIAVLD